MKPAVQTCVLLNLLIAGCLTESGVKVYNTAPVITITAPLDGASYEEDELVTIRATAKDPQDDEEDLVVSLASDIDGTLLESGHPDGDGLFEYTTANLSPGTHAITATVLDTAAASQSSTITLEVIDLPDAPELSVVHPLNGEYGIENTPFEFVALVTDARDGPEDLLVSVASDLEEAVVCEAVPDDSGMAACEAVLSVGEHFLDFEAVNLDGFTATETVFFEVKSGGLFDDDGDGYTENQGDCDDSDSSVHPNAEEYLNGADDDCDGEIDEGSLAWDNDGDCYCDYASCTGSIEPNCVVLYPGDCDDADPTISPNASEYCDGVDNDCDGGIDEPDALDASTWYGDSDGDGYGDSSVITPACGQPFGFSSNDTDCDDNDSTSYPGNPETCDGIDNDCNGTVDEGVANTYYQDNDNDGFGVSTSFIEACAPTPGYATQTGDCDDWDASVFPGAAESCDGVDNDCNGSIDENVTTTYYLDYDGDGYGVSTSPTEACNLPTGYANQVGDCDDNNASAFPGAQESCDSVDNNCDGATDEGENGAGCTNYYYDQDNDGYGTTQSICICAPDNYYRGNQSGDCYDGSNNAWPGQTSYFSSNRGDGSFDYNCDTQESQRWTQVSGSCAFFSDLCSGGDGWRSGTPSCGQGGNWGQGCYYSTSGWPWDWGCEYNSSISRTQECR